MSSHANAGEPPAVEGTSAAPAGAVPAQSPADLAATDSDPVQPAPVAAVLATPVFDPMPLRGTAAAPSDEPVSKLAIAALVTAVVALVPIAVACGVASLVGIRRTGRRGRGMAVAALFVCAAWLIVAGAIGTVGVLTHGFHKPVTITYKQAAVFRLRVGDCVGSPDGTVLPCTTPHAAEVFATFSLPDSAWPGTSAVASRARAGCGSRLSGYLNPQLAITLAQSYVYPDKTAWLAGTRTVICEVRASSGELTGSVRGAR